MNWKQFESTLSRAALVALRKVIDGGKGVFYAAAFHEFYAERNEVIHLPCLAANTVEALDGNDDGRWSSADWQWTNLPYQTREVRQLQVALQNEAASKDQSHWEKIYRQFRQAFVNVSRSLHSMLKTHRNVNPDFGVFVFTEDDEDAELLRNCTTRVKFKKLFPQLQADGDCQAAAGRLPLKGKLAIYRKDVRENERAILQLKGRALPMLVDALADEEQAWAAADLLGKLGIPDRKVIAALRKRAQAGGETRFHETSALALLGDIEFILKLADQVRTRSAAIAGISSLYSIQANECGRRIPLDYRPLEQLLSRPPGTRKVTLDGSPCEIGAADVDEALRGLQSRYAVIRQHAVSILGDRRLGKQASKTILPALAAQLQDSNPHVRHLAILSLVDWKKLAKPYATDIRRLFKDSNADVRFSARHYVKEL